MRVSSPNLFTALRPISFLRPSIEAPRGNHLLAHVSSFSTNHQYKSYTISLEPIDQEWLALCLQIKVLSALFFGLLLLYELLIIGSVNFTVPTFSCALYAICLLSLFFPQSRVRVLQSRFFSTISIFRTCSARIVSIHRRHLKSSAVPSIATYY